MNTRAWLAIAAMAGLSAAPVSAAVFKCKGADGTLTYQELPCGNADQTLRSDIASDFPAPNMAERERVLSQEAELYRRLEAQRDRLSAEAIARITRPEPPTILASEPSQAVLWPAWGGAPRWPNRVQPRNAMRAWSQGQLR